MSIYCINKCHNIKCNKINPNCGGPYIDSFYQMKNKKATISPINKNDNT